MNHDLVIGYVLLTVLSVAAAVLVPAAFVSWLRDRAERGREAQFRRSHRMPPYTVVCRTCGHSQGIHDRLKHAKAGLPIND